MVYVPSIHGYVVVDMYISDDDDIVKILAIVRHGARLIVQKHL